MLKNLFEQAVMALPAMFLKENSPAHLAYLNARIKDFEEKRRYVIAHLKKNVQFQQILPDDKLRSLHEQLLNNEKVHPVHSVKELVKERIGGPKANKICCARVNKNDGVEEVTTGIFVALRKIGEKGQKIRYNDLSGNINEVKKRPITPFHALEGDTVEAILYTISGQHPWDRGGRELAYQVHEYLHREATEQKYNLIISTLSPVRGCMKHFVDQQGYKGSFRKDVKGQWHATEAFMNALQDEAFQEDIKLKVLFYFLLEKDPVLNFHLGNGAQIGDIKFNLDNNQDWVMVNYVYPDALEILQQNAQIYESNRRLLAPHLNALLDDNKRNMALLHDASQRLFFQKSPVFL